jgi:hypothetical protein
MKCEPVLHQADAARIRRGSGRNGLRGGGRSLTPIITHYETMKAFSLLPLAFALCGCSVGVSPTGKPDPEVHGFFVCQKCHCLSATDAVEPPRVIPVHASVCPSHSWERISKRDYVRRASHQYRPDLLQSLIPPSYDLTVSASSGDFGVLLYPSAFVLRLGTRYAALSISRVGLATSIALLVAFVTLATFLWRKTRGPADDFENASEPGATANHKS